MLNVMRAARQVKIIFPAIHQFSCDECGRVYFLNAGLDGHSSLIGRPLTNYDQYNAENKLACEVYH